MGLVAAGIIAGTFLVQNGGSFLPKAANDCSGIENELAECNRNASADECREVSNRLNSCRESSTAEPKPEEKLENNPSQNNKDQEVLHPIDSQKMQSCGSDTNCKNKLCEDDEVTFCDNRSGSPRAIRKTGGYYDPNHALKDANGCVFDFFDVSSKNSECAKSNSKSGDVVFTTEKEAEEIDRERNRTLPEREKQSGSQNSSSSSSQTTACSPQATKTYNDAKVANNLARFYAIKNGAGNLCVPADLGVPEKDDVTVNGVEGRLMMCSSSDNPPKLYWMIATYETNSRLLKVPEDQKTAPQSDTIEAGFKNLQKARCAAGLDSGPTCN